MVLNVIVLWNNAYLSVFADVNGIECLAVEMSNATQNSLTNSEG